MKFDALSGENASAEMSRFCLFVFLLTSIGQSLCNVTLEMFENNGTAVIPVKTRIEVESGAGITLFCRLGDSNSRAINGKIVWGRKGKGFRFNDQLLVSNNLTFAPIRLANRGIYFCANLKKNLYRTVFIAVKPSAKVDRLLQKRTKREYGNFNVTDTSDILQTDFQSRLRNLSISFGKNADPRYLPPEITDFFKKKVYEYGDKYSGYQSFSERVREYVKMIAPLVAVTLIISTFLYCMMKKFYKYATRDKRLKMCAHNPCHHGCPRRLHNPNYGQPGNSTDADDANVNYNDDTFIFLPFLFEAK